LGTQFKFLVDYKDHDQYYKLVSFLTKNGYTLIAPDGNKDKKRLWFINENYETCKTAEGIINNFLYPK